MSTTVAIPGAHGRAMGHSWDEDQMAKPLLDAAEEGDAAAVGRLLRQGADVNAREEPHLSARYSTGWTSGKTALIKASQQDHIDVIRVLLAAGADLELRDDDGWTALFWASNNGSTAAVRQLLAAGAKVAATDNEKRTPLTYAAIMGHAEAARLLLDAGAAPGWVDRFDKTPLTLALEHDHSNVARVLQERLERASSGGSLGSAAAAAELQAQRDEAVARCRALEQELEALRARLAAAS